jgi:hypothetical protein
MAIPYVATVAASIAFFELRLGFEAFFNRYYPLALAIGWITALLVFINGNGTKAVRKFAIVTLILPGILFGISFLLVIFTLASGR